MKSCLALFLVIVSVSAAASDARPNFVIIMVDDMGYAGVSCFGNPYFETPEIDRLAREGMRLVDFHSSGTVCSPTRAGLLTGRYQQRAGIEAVIHPISDPPEHLKGMKRVENTFAELLKAEGYATGMVGKWHQGYPHNSEEYHPQEHGFDEFIGYHSGNIDFVSHVGDHVKHDWWHGRTETVEEGYSTELINKYALGFIERHGKKGSKSRRVGGVEESNPFCLYVAHEAIHNPVQVPGDPVRRSVENGWERWTGSEEERIEKYRGMTLPIDEGVGQIRRKLVELGIDRHTLVMFFSDNGASRDFPSGSKALRGSKGQVYEGGHQVPCIAWWPGKIAAGSESAVPGMTIDVMPTMLAIAGTEVPADRPLDGVDLSPVLFGEKASVGERPLYWASLGNGGNRAEAMREGEWKVVVQHPGAAPGSFENPTVELFRLSEDPGEKKNVAVENAELAEKMVGRMREWYAQTQATATEQLGGWGKSSGFQVQGSRLMSAGALEEDWEWVNEIPEEWEIEEGVLRMRCQVGRVWARREVGPHNLLLSRGSIGEAQGEVALSAQVELEDPAGKWEQGGLLLYGNLANFVKLVIEHIDGEFFVVMAEEYDGKRKVLAKLPIGEKGARLKLVVDRSGVRGYWRKGGGDLTADKDGGWVEAGRSEFPVRFAALRHWGLFTQDGVAEETRWASFRDVRY